MKDHISAGVRVTHHKRKSITFHFVSSAHILEKRREWKEMQEKH